MNHECELFGDESGETTMNDDDTISFSADSYPGISEDEPIAVVYQLQKQFAAPPPPTGNTKQLKATSGASWGITDPNWHSITIGEIFHTDGVIRT